MSFLIKMCLICYSLFAISIVFHKFNNIFTNSIIKTNFKSCFTKFQFVPNTKCVQFVSLFVVSIVFHKFNNTLTNSIIKVYFNSCFTKFHFIPKTKCIYFLQIIRNFTSFSQIQ